MILKFIAKKSNSHHPLICDVVEEPVNQGELTEESAPAQLILDCLCGNHVAVEL